MNEDGYASPGPLRHREHNERTDNNPEDAFHGSSENGHNPRPVNNTPASGQMWWTVLDTLVHRWHWVVLGTCIGGAAFYLLGWYGIKPKYTASAQLLRFETPGRSEYLKPPTLSAETFAGVMRSPEILRRVGEQLNPPVPPFTLNKWVKIEPEPDSDLVKITSAARKPEYAVNLVNLYASNAVEFIRDQEALQAATLANEYLKKQVGEMDQDIEKLQKQFRNMPFPGLTNQLAALGGKVDQLSTNLTGQRPSLMNFSQQALNLQKAMQELNDLLVKYTPAHPTVQAKEQYIRDLEKQLGGDGTNGLPSMPFPLAAGTSGVGALGGLNPDVDIIHIKLRALEDARVQLRQRAQEAQLYAENKPASVRVFAPADMKTLKSNMRRVKIGVLSIFGGLLGLGASIALVLLVELMDRRLKTADDIARVTKLPVLTTLGNLHDMRPEDRAQWAFRTWTMLQGRLTRSPNHGLICGITSAAAGEGRSTWISLLAEAASLAGYRVLTIATRPSPTHFEEGEDFPDDISKYESKQLSERPEEPNETGSDKSNGNGNSSNALTPNVLTSPASITEELNRPNSRPVVHIPLPGWVWNLERRKQWREALSQWNRTENLVILVELPPASIPEAVLLGSNLPNMVWLAKSGSADAGETRAHLETLRHARCNLVGAVLNYDPGPSLKSRFPRWMSATAALLLMTVCGMAAQSKGVSEKPKFSPIIDLTWPKTNAAPAANPTTPPAVTNDPVAPAEATAAMGAAEESSAPQRARMFSIVHPSQRAAWQERLTLGPGDILTLNLYGQPELSRTEVAVGPDGRISYLEAQDVQAAGLTIDELRSKLDDALGKFRRAPRSMITPLTFKSKKYYMLGKVATKGVYLLDQPLTLLEAIARAHGFENVLVERNVYDLVDLQRSFLARQGQRLPINFERLFHQGDLSQNVAIEPGDYVYFAGGDVNEVYVVGEVRLPGPVTYYEGLTIVGAIAQRAGYSDRAYKSKVLVLRGSLSNPEKIVVNTHAILDANAPDFKLKPRDIIFVNSRPLIKLEEAADLAATAFIQSIVTSWVGVDVVKPIN